MKTLPWDCFRCHPANLSDKCKECLRWQRMPGQDWGPRTPLAFVESHGATGCDFVPHYPSEERKK